jgi:hypothetical protein
MGIIAHVRVGSFSTDQSGVASGPFPLSPESGGSAFITDATARVKRKFSENIFDLIVPDAFSASWPGMARRRRA